MGYHEDRKEMLRMVENWCYNENREPFTALVRDVAMRFGFGELTVRKGLTLLSEGKLEVNEDGELVKAE